MSKYVELLEKDETHKEDIERKALFWILANNDDLYSKINHIYDFKDHCIIPECLENDQVDFCSSSRSLIKLGYNLYNGYPADILDTLSALDHENFTMAIQSILVRFI